MPSRTSLIVAALGVMAWTIGLRGVEAQHEMPQPGTPPPHMLAEMCAAAFERKGSAWPSWRIRTATRGRSTSLN